VDTACRQEEGLSGPVNIGFILNMQRKLYRWQTTVISSITHGEPDAWKLARPVRREACRNLRPQGSKALHAYSTRWFIAHKYDGSDRRGKRGPAPKKANSIRKLGLQMAAENES
jgi:hypothetical protein